MKRCWRLLYPTAISRIARDQQASDISSVSLRRFGALLHASRRPWIRMGSSVRADTSLLPARRMSGEEEYECFGRSDVDLNPVAFLHAIDQIGARSRMVSGPC